MVKKLTCSIFIADLGDRSNSSSASSSHSSRTIYFKNDGTRFEPNICASTLKLSNENRYRFRIVLKSTPSSISAIRINDIPMQYQCRYDDDDECVELSFEMDARQISIAANHGRTRLIIQIDFMDFHHLDLGIQTKFYDRCDSHLTWGQPFRSLIAEAESSSSSLKFNDKNFVLTKMNFLSM
ncbi:hypothetical protein DERF_014188 [Dermatophagoides farinae]|uniref:CB1 cannabinoid receptor-interacting protein 1 n=1 Tax=Dermatophagoides farinae TaxID=6954 RepID=A0A922HH00_DERFA|nr:hypothetical protein DERF_014188 [Dermatophagoides farinae]